MVFWSRRRAKPGGLVSYVKRLGNAAELAATRRETVQPFAAHVYGAVREVVAADQVVMLKTLRCPVRVVWVYRQTGWVALMTTDLALSIEQIIEYCSARRTIEAGFRETTQEIGSAHTQTRNPDAVFNHLNFSMVATTVTWLYAAHRSKLPAGDTLRDARPNMPSRMYEAPSHRSSQTRVLVSIARTPANPIEVLSSQQ